MLPLNSPEGLVGSMDLVGCLCAGMGLLKFVYRAVNRVLIADARQIRFVLRRGRGLK